MNGLDIARKVYQRLRRPSQAALPWQNVLDTVGDVVGRKLLDLSLANQNALGETSAWFTPSSADFSLEDLGLNVMLPLRVERRAVDSEYETGEQVPIVNYEVLDTSFNGAISFYGTPLRMVFRDQLDYIAEQQYRIIYEPDFLAPTGLSSQIRLPGYFESMIALEAAYELLEQVEDTSPEWIDFVKMTSGRWEMQITDKRVGWEQYCRSFKGRAQVPKRTYLDNRRCRTRTRYFKG